MSEADETIEITMPASQEVDGEYVLGVRVKRLGNQAIGMGDNIALDPNGDYKIITRDPVPNRPGWWHYTIQRVS